MINTLKFYNTIVKNEVDFFTGVPDSLLKEFCFCITDNTKPQNHIINTNEGSAVGLSIGYNLATGKTPLVYLQNSGLGNIINPYVSLSHRSVFNIPMLLFIGWRGEPGQIDEPQHKFQGKITEQLLQLLDIEYEVLEADTIKSITQITRVIKKIKIEKKSVAILVKKNTFTKYDYKPKNNQNVLEREKCISAIHSSLRSDDIIISTTGKTSREVYEAKVKNNYQSPSFFTIGGMGHCNQISLGIANNTTKRVFCFDGDGSSLMHLGSLGITGMNARKNLHHIIFNNGSHESVGGQPTIANDVNFKLLSESLGYKKYILLDNEIVFKQWIEDLNNSDEGPTMIEIKIKNFSRSNLGRPKESPIEQKKYFLNQFNGIKD